MNKFEEFQFAFDHVEKLLDRRQSMTSFYLSVNTGIFAAIGLLLKHPATTGVWLRFSILMLLCAGFIACWIWRSLLRQYEILLDWWYTGLRELERSMPDSARLVTREYEDLYVPGGGGKPIGMTRRELALNWIFTALYMVFAVGILGVLLFA